MKIKIFLLFFLFVFLAACNQGESPEALAETMVAQTAAALPPTREPTTTLFPPTATFTPMPTETPTDTVTPTATSTSTETAIPPTETLTPTFSPTPGPVSFFDDFSEENRVNWGNCDICAWVDGRLIVGPYPSDNTLNAFYAICEACGTLTYYRVKVDVAFVEGQTDRGIGLLAFHTPNRLVSFEVSPLFLGSFAWEQNRNSGGWDFLNLTFDSAFNAPVRGGTQTNTLEIIVQPRQNSLTADIYFRINDANVVILYNQRVEPGQVGVLVGFHSIGASFDNFEFEELGWESE